MKVARPIYGKNERVDFWDVDDSAETLSHTEIGEAIGYWADGLGPDECLPREVTVYGWAREPLPFTHSDFAVTALDHIADYMLEEYISPDDGPCWPEEVIEAARDLGRVILEKWEPWSCRVVTEERVDMAEWVRENYPLDGYPDPILVEAGCGMEVDPRTDCLATPSDQEQSGEPRRRRETD